MEHGILGMAVKSPFHPSSHHLICLTPPRASFHRFPILSYLFPSIFFNHHRPKKIHQPPPHKTFLFSLISFITKTLSSLPLPPHPYPGPSHYYHLPTIPATDPPFFAHTIHTKPTKAHSLALPPPVLTPGLLQQQFIPNSPDSAVCANEWVTFLDGLGRAR